MAPTNPAGAITFMVAHARATEALSQNSWPPESCATAEGTRFAECVPAGGAPDAARPLWPPRQLSYRGREKLRAAAIAAGTIGALAGVPSAQWRNLGRRGDRDWKGGSRIGPPHTTAARPQSERWWRPDRRQRLHGRGGAQMGRWSTTRRGCSSGLAPSITGSRLARHAGLESYIVEEEQRPRRTYGAKEAGEGPMQFRRSRPSRNAIHDLADPIASCRSYPTARAQALARGRAGRREERAASWMTRPI